MNTQFFSLSKNKVCLNRKFGCTSLKKLRKKLCPVYAAFLSKSKMVSVALDSRFKPLPWLWSSSIFWYIHNVKVYSRILPCIAAEVDKAYSKQHDFPVVWSKRGLKCCECSMRSCLQLRLTSSVLSALASEYSLRSYWPTTYSTLYLCIYDINLPHYL